MRELLALSVFESSVPGGEWFELKDVPVPRNTGLVNLIEKKAAALRA